MATESQRSEFRRYWADNPAYRAKKLEYQRKWRKKPGSKRERNRWSADHSRRKKLMVDAIKMARGCEGLFCPVPGGYREFPEGLTFDHLDGETKSFDICKGVYSKGVEAILAEIEKCVVLCAICHNVVTHGRRLLKTQGPEGP